MSSGSSASGPLLNRYGVEVRRKDGDPGDTTGAPVLRKEVGHHRGV